MNSITVYDRSTPPAAINVWRLTPKKNSDRLAIRAIAKDGSGEIVGAFLPVHEARRLIKFMTQICEDIEGDN